MENLPDIIKDLPIWLQYLIAVLILLAMFQIFPLSFVGRWIARWPMHKLWPGRDGWQALCIAPPQDSNIARDVQSDPNNAWDREKRRWSNGKKMIVSDWYELILDKPRSLSRISVRSQDRRFPKKLRFRTKELKDSVWVTEVGEKEVDIGYDDQPTVFNHSFGKHRQIASMRIEIVEPNEEKWTVGEGKGCFPAWAIYDIDVKEYRLFGCLWEHEIG